MWTNINLIVINWLPTNAATAYKVSEKVSRFVQKG